MPDSSDAQRTAAAVIRHVEPCMGTVFSFDLRTAIDPAALIDAIGWLHWADTVFSTYRPDSDICQLADNRKTVADCAPDVAVVLALCEQFHARTGGYFDAWAGGTLDPSGVVKGWAVDRVDAQLRAAGSRRHCINAGGDIRCAGGRSASQPWRLGIADPFAPGELVAVVEGYDFALATSGVAQRGNHILDPHTGRPPWGLASVSLIGADLTTTDAFATAVFAMGGDALNWIDNTKRFTGLAITAGGEHRSTIGSAPAEDSAHPGPILRLGLPTAWVAS